MNCEICLCDMRLSDLYRDESGVILCPECFNEIHVKGEKYV